MRHPASLTRNNHGTSVSAGPTLVTKRQTWCEFRQLSHEFLFSIQNGNHIHSENLTAVSGEKQSHKGQRLQVTGFKAMAQRPCNREPREGATKGRTLRRGKSPERQEASLEIITAAPQPPRPAAHDD